MFHKGARVQAWPCSRRCCRCELPSPHKKWGAASVFGRPVPHSPTTATTATGPRLSDIELEFETARAIWIGFCSDVVFVDECPQELEEKTEGDLCLVKGLMGLGTSKLHTRADGPAPGNAGHAPNADARPAKM